MTEEIDPNHGLQEELDVETYMEELKQIEFCPKRGSHSTGARYICPYGCGKMVAMRTIDYHKNNGCTRRGSDMLTSNPDLKKRYYCCGVCYTEFVTRVEFHAHLRVDHDVHPEITNVSFKDRYTFDRFLRWLEMEGGAHFRHKSGAKRRGKGKGIFLACNRSGFVTSSQCRVQADRTGPFRLGYSCTAYIHATEHDDGHVTGEVCGDHYGHDARMRLPNIIKYIIAHKQLDGEQPIEIIGYLRTHFLPFSHENIYAQRICFVDIDELRAIYVSSTKKWEQCGIPQKCEVWEEELLDRAGINREGVPRLREYSEKTTSEIAIEENWPRPRVFVAKTRAPDGTLVPVDEARNGEVSIMQNDYVHNEEVEDTRFPEENYDSRYMDYAEDSRYVAEEQGETSNDHSHNREYLMKPAKTEDFEQRTMSNQLLDDDDVEVEVETEVQTSATSSRNVKIADESNEMIPEHENEVMMNRNERNAKMEGIDMSEEPGPSGSQGDDPRFYDGPNSLAVQAILEEVDSFKMTLLKRAENITPSNLRSVLIRFQCLHNSISDKQQIEPGSLTVYPSRARLTYRPGKGLEKPESQFMNVRGDVALLPIEDEMSDDEGLFGEPSSFNANIWN